MFSGQEEYFQELLALVKQEISLYTKYAVRMKEDGRLRHIYNTKIFKDELANVLEDSFSHMSRADYEKEREALFLLWQDFHERAYHTIKSGVMLPFEYLLRKLGLTEPEQYMACLAMAPELNREFERMYCYLQDDLAWRYPSLDLCVKMYTMDELKENTLIHQTFARRELLYCIFDRQPAGQESGLAWRLKLRRDLIDFIFFYDSDLLGRKAEYRLRMFDGRKEADLSINREVAEAIGRHLEEDDFKEPGEQNVSGRLFLLRGPYGSGKKQQVRLAAGALGYSVLLFDIREVAGRREDQMLEAVGDAVVRAVLDRAFLVFCHWESIWSGEQQKRQSAQEMLRKASLFFRDIFLTVEEEPGEDVMEGQYPVGYRIEEFRMRLPSIQERSLLWREFLEEEPGQEDAALFDRLAAQFDFTPGVIREAAEFARREAKNRGERQVSADLLYRACQQKISHRLGERASRVNAVYTWDDLVLEDGPKELLRQACGQVAYRGMVYEQWGFQDKIAYGRGVSLLFAGPPGTGKTMAAQVLARELNLELYKVDLSGVLSKYIGETQKNLREIFDEVKKSRSILFFDEADVLFGKRVDVSDARDISANAQTAYLLQKMEEYDGITILATNLMQNFDDAYKRRMKYIIRFAFPQREQRVLLWEKVFPEQMPLQKDIDIPYLADNFELSGASIKNIALNAAFIAASRQEITGMEHIMTALQQEYEKSGKVLGKAELKEYYGYKI